jgi:pimeloyl-ACP methyl ester carboxylesterase
VSEDVAIVRSTLDSIPGDKILVGHSYGGFVITNAASGRTDVRGLVYTAAYVPDRGETINDLGIGYTPGTFLDHLVFRPVVPTSSKIRSSFRGLRPDLNQSWAPGSQPSCAGELRPLRNAIRPGRCISVVVRSLGDRAIDPALQFMALRAGSTTVGSPPQATSGASLFRSTLRLAPSQRTSGWRDRNPGPSRCFLLRAPDWGVPTSRHKE